MSESVAPPRAALFQVLSCLRPIDSWEFTIEVPGVEGTFQTAVRAGPFLHWRAMRKMERLARSVAETHSKPA